MLKPLIKPGTPHPCGGTLEEAIMAMPSIRTKGAFVFHVEAVQCDKCGEGYISADMWADLERAERMATALRASRRDGAGVSLTLDTGGRCYDAPDGVAASSGAGAAFWRSAATGAGV